MEKNNVMLTCISRFLTFSTAAVIINLNEALDYLNHIKIVVAQSVVAVHHNVVDGERPSKKPRSHYNGSPCTLSLTTIGQYCGVLCFPLRPLDMAKQPSVI